MDRNAEPAEVSTDRSEQTSIGTRHLLWVATRFFIERLRMPVQPDWGITPEGACQCRDGARCGRAGKHPGVKDPRSHATYDVQQAAEWVLRGRNIAAVPESYLVVDIELKAGHNGLIPFREWCRLAGLDADELLSTTLTVRSGGGGLHLWFWLPQGMVPPKGMDGWLPDVDIKTARKRSDKATIPGSRHSSGRLYEFELNALDGHGFPMPIRAPQVLVEEVAAGRAWELLATPEWPAWSASEGAVNYGDFSHASVLWRRARILAPGDSRPGTA
jgi:hypothetical protein